MPRKATALARSLLLLLAATLLPGCAEDSASQGDLLDRVLAAGKIVVSADANYPPQSFLDGQGELDGFDVDVAREVARRLGVRAEFVTPDWELIAAGSWCGRWDLSIGSMCPTEARAEVLWFTRPYYCTPASFAIHKDNQTLKTPADLVGKQVGAGVASTYEVYLRGELTLLGAELLYEPPRNVVVKTYSTDSEAVEDLALGDGVRLDAVMTAQPTLKNAMDSGRAIRFLGGAAYCEPLAFALDKCRGSSAKMLARLNEIIAQMHKDGTLRELSLEWYGMDLTAPEPSGGGTRGPR